MDNTCTCIVVQIFQVGNTRKSLDYQVLHVGEEHTVHLKLVL